MSEWVQRVIRRFGCPGIVFLMVLENLFPPIPSEVVLPFSGFVGSQGDLSLLAVVVAATAGSVLGALPLYWLGSHFGFERLERLAARHGAWFTVGPHDMRRAREWFDRHGWKAVLLCRAIPGLRSLISIPAGVARMALPRFLLWTTLGSAVWCALLASLGYRLAAEHDRVATYLDPLLWIWLVLAVSWYLWRLIGQRRARH